MNKYVIDNEVVGERHTDPGIFKLSAKGNNHSELIFSSTISLVDPDTGFIEKVVEFEDLPPDVYINTVNKIKRLSLWWLYE